MGAMPSFSLTQALLGAMLQPLCNPLCTRKEARSGKLPVSIVLSQVARAVVATALPTTWTATAMARPHGTNTKVYMAPAAWMPAFLK